MGGAGSTSFLEKGKEHAERWDALRPEVGSRRKGRAEWILHLGLKSTLKAPSRESGSVLESVTWAVAG